MKERKLKELGVPARPKVKDLNSVKETAVILGKSVSGIHHLRHTGELKALRIGKQWVIPRDEIQRYRRNHKRE